MGDGKQPRGRGFNGWNAYMCVIWFATGVNAWTAAGNDGDPASPWIIAAATHVMIALVFFTRNTANATATILVPEIALFTFTTIAIPGIVVPGATRVVYVALLLACHGIITRVIAPGRPRLLAPLLLAAGAAALAIPVSLLEPDSGALVPLAWTGTIALPVTMLTLLLVFQRVFATPASYYHPILTHHLVEDADHAIPLTFGNVTIFTCTRCTGMIAGVAASAYIIHALGITIPSFTAFVMDIFVPVPIFVDWGLQRLGKRTSSTRSRLFTGALTGFGFYLLTFTAPDYTLPTGIVLATYFCIFFLIYFVSSRRGYRSSEDIDETGMFDDGHDSF